MKRLQSVRNLYMILAILLFAMGIMTCSGKAMAFYKEYVIQVSTVRGVQSLTDASNIVISDLSSIARKCAWEEYEALNELILSDKVSNLEEEVLGKYYSGGYFAKLSSTVGETPEDIKNYMNGALKLAGCKAEVVNQPHFIVEYNEDEKVISIKLSDVDFIYEDPILGDRSDTVSYSINIPKAIFFTENSSIAKSCMVAQKGIYITGPTSSIIGNIYAGTHTKDERRDAEGMYGEAGTYGGINILSTQLGIYSDTIISTGDININGSFVILSPETDELNCYAKNLNSVNGFTKDSMYSLDGIFNDTDLMSEDTLTDYFTQVNRIANSMVRFGNIEDYYDSKNDFYYNGPYRKIISPYDIEIKSDFTGVIMTPGNVIINSDINVEGIIMCGDRIYVRGNNNIVGNSDILRKIILYESETEGSNLVIDYLDGIKSSGLDEPDYYVVPYR